MERTCLFVICAAPLAQRAPDIAQALVDDDWTVLPVATPSAGDGWVDAEALRRITGFEARSTYRAPDQPKTRREPDLVLLCPATFNTIGKLANGLADNYALGVLSEALGGSVPIVVVPMINQNLWRHPALEPSLDRLAEAGVIFIDPNTAKVGRSSIASGSGAQISADFDPSALVAAAAYYSPVRRDNERQSGSR